MVTSIQLGNFFTSGGKTVLGGVGGSGLDTQGLVKGLTEAKRLPAVALEDKVTKNDKVSSALNEFKTLLATFKDAVSFLRNPPGVANQASNAFAYTKADVTTNDGSIAGNYLSVATSPGVTPQIFNVSDIASVASAKQQSTGNITFISPATTFDADSDFVTAVATGNHFKVGTVTVNGQAITLEAGDSLNDVAAKFNARKTDTGIAANVIKVSDNNYRLVFTATKTGLTSNFNLNTMSDPGGVFNGTVFANLQTASNAVFTLNGVEITRENNAISDVVNGVTFNISDDVLKRDAGPIDVEISSLKDTKTRLSDEIAKIDLQVERFRQSLLDKFASLESALSKVNSLLQSIDAQNKARNQN